VKKAELENLLRAMCEYAAPDSIGNDYLVFGTMDRKDWKRGPFKDVWKFEVRPAGWYPKGE